MKSKLPSNEVFVKRLNLLMTSHSVPSKIQKRANVLAELCETSTQASRKWLTGASLPGYEHMMKIAARYSVTTSYLLGEVNVKNLGLSDKNAILKDSVKSGVMTIDIHEDMFHGLLQIGDTAICEPTNSVTVDGDIYVLQSAQQRFFRKLNYDETGNLIISYEENGIEENSVYKESGIIELFLASLVGRVEAVIRKVKNKS